MTANSHTVTLGRAAQPAAINAPLPSSTANCRPDRWPLDALCASGFPEDILALHTALEQFSIRDPLKAKLVELRFFGGLTLEQAAACLEISVSTADRAWRYSRARLYAAMADGDLEKT